MLKALRIGLVLATALSLSACASYRPLYGKGPDGVSVTQGLSNISVPEQHSRAGQLLRNELLDGMGASPSPRYSLKLEITEKTIDVSSLSSSSAARKRYNLVVHYDVLDTVSGKSATSGDSFSNVSFDIINQPVSDLSAADNAKLRAAKELGQDLKLRLAAFLSTIKG
jgi:LPS-assembly lipoprotein